MVTYRAALLVLVGQECEGEESDGAKNIDRDSQVVSSQSTVAHCSQDGREKGAEAIAQNVLAELRTGTATNRQD